MIVDEADERVAKEDLRLKYDELLTRLYSQDQSKQVFLVSATATDFLVDLGDVLQDSKPENLMTYFPSKAEISTPAAKRSQLDTFFSKARRFC